MQHLILVNVFLFSYMLAEQKTWKEICKKYFGIKREFVRNYLEKCTICKNYNPLKKTDLFRNIRSKAPWERIQIDLVDIRKYSDLNDGYSWILNV